MADDSPRNIAGWGQIENGRPFVEDVSNEFNWMEIVMFDGNFTEICSQLSKW